MLKIFLFERLPNKPDSQLLTLIVSKNEFEGGLFQKTATRPFHNMVEFVSNIEEAHYILLPHDYRRVKSETNYLKDIEDLAERNNKKIIVFLYGDLPEKALLKKSIVLRTCSYRSTLSPNEVIVPPFIEDLGSQYKIKQLYKSTELPVVGFVGMVSFPTVWKEIKYQLKIRLHKIQVIFGKRKKTELQGIYFRRKVVKELSKSISCKTNFVIRNSFSANKKTISIDPTILRQEYIDVLQKSDLGLVVRGDGNYSLRFFEVLSLGQIPLFIDTDTPLPLEDQIDYDSFMLRVNYNDIPKISEIITEFWNNTSQEKFIDMQNKARYVFENKLRTDSFYKKLFTDLTPTE